ncbi:MAG: YetF domain-containing protein [Bacillota bacterium]
MIDFNEIIQVLTHTLAVFFLLILMTRLIGKKFLAQMTFFDFVTGIIIGTIGGAYVTTQIKGVYVLLSPIILTILVVITGFLGLKNVSARKLIEGEPLVMIQNGKIYEKNMRKIRYNVDDLMMQLREKGIFDLGEVEFAILETHGQLSVLKKSQYLPATPRDLGINTIYKGVSSEIIRDGKIVEQNLKQNNLDHEWLYNELSFRNIKNIRDIFLATLSTDGKLYVDLKNDNPAYIQEVEDDDSVI